MALDDYFETEVGVAVAVTAALFSPRVRKVLRRGAVYGVAGALMAGDALTAFAKGVSRSAQQVAASANQAAAATAQNAANASPNGAKQTTPAGKETPSAVPGSAHEASPTTGKGAGKGTGGGVK